MGIILVKEIQRRRYIEGLKNRPKSGRYPDIPEEKVQEIKNELASSKQGWTTKQIEDLIVRKSGGTRYHYTHIYRLICTNGDSNKKYLERRM
jgi:transposase